MKSIFYPSCERGKKDIGWLQSNFFFSFSDYYEPVKSSFGTIMAFNDDYLQVGKGFGIHPHMNMEIISVMVRGKMNHKDSMGYENVVHEDWVQIMSAGSGLRHEEYNVGDEEVNFLQIWILPKLQNIIPRYQWRNFPRNERKNQLTTIVSGEEGPKHCWINQNAKLSLGYYDAGQQINYTLNPTNKCLFVFNIEGLIEAGGHQITRKDACGFWEAGELVLVTKEESQFLIIETPVNQK